MGHLIRVLKLETKTTFNITKAKCLKTATLWVSRVFGTIFASYWVLDDTSKSGF